ncbi:phosphonate metabolism transcriptional regulator PhnF [Desulfuromonas carbonis]|uniref:phosphonate metabolism transcriptional regulator PhnF n=1 Tax=Desulfuromonas sp. DDH964 TaxID=1823759 RepID=UPI00078C5543|nr:phosphonate metabolism transcriptional regulator PhnF [Desulfuromonas sp. DDH964]AMV73708.1 GntR family transcriptional regulator [Desulfuromonas sp. DDH964]
MAERSAGLARYRQISRRIEEEIESGRYPIGHQLPTEHNLGLRYGVNRHTAREALRQLKDNGLVYSIRGKGTFVASDKVPYQVSKKVRFSSAILEAGLLPGARLLGAGLEQADPWLAARLELEPGAPILALEILRSVNGIPFSLALSWLPGDPFAGLVDYLGEGFSLYALLRDLHGIDASRKSSIFEVTLAKKREGDLLQIPRSVPLLTTRSLATDQHQRPIEYCVSRMRGDLGSIVIDFAGK